jgi:hypothetical protein
MAEVTQVAGPVLPYTVHTGADSSGEIERISAHDITPDEFAQKYIKRCPRACPCVRVAAAESPKTGE